MPVLSIHVTSETPGSSSPLHNAQILAIYSNGTHLTGATDSEGYCYLDLYRTDDSMVILAAAKDHNAYVWANTPKDHDNRVHISMRHTKDGTWGHSILFEKSIGGIPGIAKPLNPIKDSHGRYFLYGDNLSFNDGIDQPYQFQLKEWIKVTDSKGMETSIRFIVVERHFSLLEYTTPEPYQANDGEDS